MDVGKGGARSAQVPPPPRFVSQQLTIIVNTDNRTVYVDTVSHIGSCGVLKLCFIQHRIDWDDMMGEGVDYFSRWKCNKATCMIN